MSIALKFNGVVQEQISISWKKVNVVAESDVCCGLFPPTERELIHDGKPFGNNGAFLMQFAVSGEAKCGRLLAIMGSSGAGKTTLLSAISGRQVDGLDVDGIFGINGYTTNLRTIQSVSAFVPQDDIFLSNLTVAEHLNYQLDLQKCLNVYIGGLRRKGISGGEKKRVAVASEIIGCPPVLFLDEPTSGLDLHIAEKIVTLLRKLCAGGSTIICTIHQPSSQMFHQFDDLLLLSEGRVAFLGTLGDAQTFFGRQGADIPLRYNPIDVYIKMLAIDSNDYHNCIERSEEICYAFESSEFRELIYIDRKPVKLNALDFRSSNWTQFTVIMRRTFVNNWREQMYGASLIQDFIAAFIFSLIVGRQEINQTAVKNINGTLYFLILMLTFQLCFLEIRSFYEELPLIKRELESGIYSATLGFWGYVIAQLPHQLLSVLLFTVIVYINVGFGAYFTRFCNYILTAVLYSQAVISFTYLFRNF
ncbi:protein white-like protein, partial [Leptotrombidium deliense]